MGKKVIFVASLVLNVILVVLIAICSSNLYSIWNTLNSAKTERNNNKTNYDAVESENKKLLAKMASLEQQVALLQNELASAQRKSASTEDNAPATPETVSGSAHTSESSYGTGQLADARLTKARQLGKILALIDPEQMESGAPSPEALRQLSEVLKIMAELEMPIMERHSPNKNFLVKPELRQLLTNVLIGALEELKAPLSTAQISQYERALEKLSEVANKIAPQQATPTERLIARLQNSDVIQSVNKEFRDVFTDEQRRLLESETLREPFDLTPELYGSYVNASIRDFNEQVKASDYILQQWAGAISTSEADKEILRPIAEQYLRDYIVLRNTMEGVYGKGVMDVYLSRNKPSKEDKAKQTEYAVALASSDYNNAKNAMDIEFLQLINRYHKEISSRLGSDKAYPLIKRVPKMIHFPNVN